MITLENILVATDFSEPSDVAFTYGRELAKRFDATLHVLHVVQNISVAGMGVETAFAMGPEVLHQLEEDARNLLHEQLVDSDGSGPKSKAVVSIAVSPAASIVDYARSHDIGLIVVGTNGRSGVAHFVMGSVAERVVQLAHCPVLAVRTHERDFVRPDTLVASGQAAR
jgi:universal stress protein A